MEGLIASGALFLAWCIATAAPFFLARRRKKQELKRKRQWAEARQRSMYVYEDPEAEADELERFARFHDIFDDRD